MHRRLYRRPSPAIVIALIALFVALGGSAYAALRLPRNSVGSAQLRRRRDQSQAPRERVHLEQGQGSLTPRPGLEAWRPLCRGAQSGHALWSRWECHQLRRGRLLRGLSHRGGRHGRTWDLPKRRPAKPELRHRSESPERRAGLPPGCLLTTTRRWRPGHGVAHHAREQHRQPLGNSELCDVRLGRPRGASPRAGCGRAPRRSARPRSRSVRSPLPRPARARGGPAPWWRAG
jgi:hypothetical protein